jgi:hypothetical protein
VWVRPPPALQVSNLGIFRPKSLYIEVFGKGKIMESPLGVICGHLALFGPPISILQSKKITPRNWGVILFVL